MIEQESVAGVHPLAPIAGIRGLCALQMAEAESLSMVDYPGRQIRADKSGTIEGPAPAALAPPGLSPGYLDASGVGGEIRLQ